MSRRLLLLLLTAALLAPSCPRSRKAPSPSPTINPLLEFPDRLTFQAKFQNDRPIEKVVLEYGVDQWTCGTVIAKAFPDITPGQEVSAEWTWEMKQSGSQPPGSKIWWRWHIFDDQGKEIVTNRKETVWLDDQHDWQTASGDNINLHWYDGGASFGTRTAPIRGEVAGRSGQGHRAAHGQTDRSLHLRQHERYARRRAVRTRLDRRPGLLPITTSSSSASRPIKWIGASARKRTN